MSKKPYQNSLFNFIEKAKSLGLDKIYLDMADEFYGNYEFELAFDILITQIYECDIKISPEVYEQILDIAKQMKLNLSGYSSFIMKSGKF
jgi:hypothetical protein